MPNGTFAPGSPVVNALRGFDRPGELYCVELPDGKGLFIGYPYQCAKYGERHQIKRLNQKTGKPYH